MPQLWFRFILLYLLLLCLTGCVSKTEPTPPLPPAKMAAVMGDMLMSEFGLQTLPMSSTQRDSAMMTHYALILKHHKLSEKQFNEAFEFYRLHPNQMVAMYDSALNRLSAQMARERLRSHSVRPK